MKSKMTRAKANIHWIEEHCNVPTGPHRGEYAILTAAQRQTIREIYDAPDGPLDLPVTDKELAAYLTLAHLCGYEASRPGQPPGFRPSVNVDVFTLWAAAGPLLREVLRREGEAVICPELGNRFPWAA
jgi:hypothetical protein